MAEMNFSNTDDSNSSSNNPGPAFVVVGNDGPERKDGGGVYLGFIDAEASADGSYFKFAMLPVLYRGPGNPASVVGGCSMYYKVAAKAPVKDDKGKVIGDTGSWLVTMFFTLFEVMFPYIIAAARQTRNDQVAVPMRKIMEAYPGIKFVVRDAQISVAALNDILTTEHVPNVSPVVFSELRDRIGVIPGPVNARSSASISLDQLHQDRWADFIEPLRLAQEFLDFSDSHILAAAAAAASK